jgi:hypothetical protein
MTKPIMLSDWVRDYALRHDLSQKTRFQLELVAKQFEKFTRGKSIGEITADDLNRFANSSLGRNERVTVAGKICRLRTLLKAAHRSHLCGRIDDGEVRKVRVPHKPVRRSRRRRSESCWPKRRRFRAGSRAPA